MNHVPTRNYGELDVNSQKEIQLAKDTFIFMSKATNPYHKKEPVKMYAKTIEKMIYHASDTITIDGTVHRIVPDKKIFGQIWSVKLEKLT